MGADPRVRPLQISQLALQTIDFCPHADVANFLSHRLKASRRSTPPQLLYVVEERRVGAQRRELLEEQRVPEIIVVENLNREVFKRPMLINEPCSCLRSVARDSWITIRGVTHQREVIGNAHRRYPELREDSLSITNLPASAIDLDHTIFDHALRKILVRRPDAHFLDSLVQAGEMSGGGERVVCFELDHWPHRHAH